MAAIDNYREAPAFHAGPVRAGLTWSGWTSTCRWVDLQTRTTRSRVIVRIRLRQMLAAGALNCKSDGSFYHDGAGQVPAVPHQAALPPNWRRRLLRQLMLLQRLGAPRWRGERRPSGAALCLARKRRCHWARVRHRSNPGPSTCCRTAGDTALPDCPATRAGCSGHHPVRTRRRRGRPR